MRPRVAVAGIVLFLLLSQGAALAVEDPSYELSPWPYGAIAWVGGAPDDYQTLSRTLSQAVEDVFSLWELPSPSPMLGWEDPSLNESAWKTGLIGPIPQVLKKDPKTNQLWRLNPLQWENTEIYSLLYIAFPTRVLLAQAVGTTAISARWAFGPAAREGSEVWYQAITGVPNSITAPAVDGLTSTWHELAHWMTYIRCLQDEVDLRTLPEFLVEGIAEYTEASLVGVTGWKRYAANWATENALTVELNAYDTYRIGLSVVAYLVEIQGASGFFASLSSWAEDPANQIILLESDWHEWLVLE